MRLLAVLALFCLWTSSSYAQDVIPGAPSSTPPVLGLTVSGGVSLGSFEAGYLYYLFETLKLNPGLVEPKIFTGASAGSANALLSFLAGCSPRDPRPDESLFYQLWIPVGLKQLFSPNNVTQRSLFSQNALREKLDLIGKIWKDGLPASCEATLGLSTTRVTAARVDLIKDRVSLARTEAKFALHVKGRGPGKPPMTTNYVGERELMQRPMLPVEQDGSVSFESIKQVLLASAAFPLAFEPVSVLHCTARGEDARCTPDRASIALFMDGGVFDNQPLRLAVQLAQQGLVGTGAQRHFADAPSMTANATLRDDVLFVYVDPSVQVLPSVDAAEAAQADDSTVSYLLRLFEQLVESSRSKELQVLLEDNPDVTKQITATHTYFMPLSDPLYSFLGFFETDFRIHDFYLGMHSAHRWFTEVVNQKRPDLRATFPEQVYPTGDDALKRGWAPYRCMRAAFDGVEPIEVCNDVDVSIRAGIQTSLDRIYARCTQLRKRAEAAGTPLRPTAHEHCRAAFLGEKPPLLPGMKTNAGFEFEGDESTLDHELRRLATHGFVFKDMEVPNERALDARRYVAQKIGTMVRALAGAQERGALRALLPAVGRVASQALAYVPPYASWHVLMGRGLEAGYSLTGWDTKLNWMRAAFALELDGLFALASKGESNALKLTPMVGLELELLPLSSYRYQTRFGFRGGFAFSTVDDFLTDRCTEADGAGCSRVRGEAYIAFIVYQLLRAQLGFAAYPPMRDSTSWDYSIQPRIGLELDRP